MPTPWKHTRPGKGHGYNAFPYEDWTELAQDWHPTLRRGPQRLPLLIETEDYIPWQGGVVAPPWLQVVEGPMHSEMDA